MSKEEGQGSESVADVVENVVEGVGGEANEEVAGGDSGAADASPSGDAMSSVTDALATLKSWGKTASGAVGSAWSTVGAWQEEGTPLRKVFKEARLGVDDAAAKLRQRNLLWEEDRQKKFQEILTKRKGRFENLDKSGMLTKCKEVKRTHPELIVGGLTLAVALPSALAGKRAFFRNGSVALMLSSGVLYGGDWFKRRIVSKMDGRKDRGGDQGQGGAGVRTH